jgi:HEAT repeat protein
MMEEINNWRAELQSPDLKLRTVAAERLCQAGSDASDAAVDLVRACGDDEAVSNWAVAALEELGTPPISAVESLTALASDKNSLVAYWAATLLGRLGPDATDSQAKLASVLITSQEVAVQERFAWALGKIGVTSDEALKALSQVAKGDDSRLSRLAQEALEQAKK